MAQQQSRGAIAQPFAAKGRNDPFIGSVYLYYRIYYYYIVLRCCKLQRREFEKQPKIPKKHNKGRQVSQLRISSAWCCSGISLPVG